MFCIMGILRYSFFFLCTTQVYIFCIRLHIFISVCVHILICEFRMIGIQLKQLMLGDGSFYYIKTYHQNLCSLIDQ